MPNLAWVILLVGFIVMYAVVRNRDAAAARFMLWVIAAYIVGSAALMVVQS